MIPKLDHFKREVHFMVVESEVDKFEMNLIGILNKFK